MKIAKLALILTLPMLFIGCAFNNVSKYPKYNYMNKMDSEAKIVGGHAIEIIGPVTWKTDKQCSVIDFVTNVTTKDGSKAHDVINIRADETKKNRAAGDADYSCKYWGLAVRYVPVPETGAKGGVKGSITFTANEAKAE